MNSDTNTDYTPGVVCDLQGIEREARRSNGPVNPKWGPTVVYRRGDGPFTLASKLVAATFVRTVEVWIRCRHCLAIVPVAVPHSEVNSQFTPEPDELYPCVSVPTKVRDVGPCPDCHRHIELVVFD